MKLKEKIFLPIFGLFLSLLILEIGMRVGGFVSLSIQEYRNKLSLKENGTAAYRIMCVGESTTQSQYPSYLEQALNRQNTGIRFSVVDKGMRGANTNIILSQLEMNLDKYKPDMVIAMIGINDSGAYVPYAKLSASNIQRFLMSFRVYKIVQLLWLHIANKGREIGSKQTNSETEETFKQAIKSNPKNDGAYAGLGCLYKDQGKLLQSEYAFKKAIELNPLSDRAYSILGRVYDYQKKFAQAEEALKKAIELNPKNDGAFFLLGDFYQNQGKLLQSEYAFKKAIELNPSSDRAYVILGDNYQRENKLLDSEQAFKKAIELNPENDNAYGGLSLVNKLLGNTDAAKVYETKANEIRYDHYIPMFVENYQKIKQILDKRGVNLVCVQYPMRSVEPLKKIFQNKTDVIFVDNEKVFKDAIEKGRFQEYFRDIFAGDFGHCTEKGNMLLAQNIANAIMEQILKK